MASARMAGRELWRNVLFVIVVPGTVAGLIPWLITRWNMEPWGPWPWLVVAVAVGLIAAGVAFLLHAVWRFASEGRGTPAPVAPTEHLVVGGAYRHVRNPMYIAVAAAIGGQALLSPSPGIVLYLLLFLTAVALFARYYEEPTLLSAHGDQYARYRESVPGWLPRRTAWSPEGDE